MPSIWTCRRNLPCWCASLPSPGKASPRHYFVSRWDEKAGLRRDAVRSQVIDVLEAQIKRRPAMKKVRTVRAKQKEFLRAKADDRFGPGRPFKLVLRVG
jgi:hypothetical protein